MKVAIVVVVVAVVSACATTAPFSSPTGPCSRAKSAEELTRCYAQRNSEAAMLGVSAVEKNFPGFDPLTCTVHSDTIVMTTELARRLSACVKTAGRVPERGVRGPA
jgi:hypothetical protein